MKKVKKLWDQGLPVYQSINWSNYGNILKYLYLYIDDKNSTNISLNFTKPLVINIYILFFYSF